jgi:hypothetical protein
MHKQTTMKQFILLAGLVIAMLTSVTAQSVDPWITKAYNEIYKRTPSTAEANIKNYNNGTWSSFPELVSYIVAYNNKKAGAHIKGDPWVFQAYYEMYNRTPIEWELNIKNYNNGSWSNYDELKKFITEYQNALVINRLKVVMAKVKAATAFAEMAAVFIQDGKVIAADLIGNDAGSILVVGGQALAAKGATALIGLDGVKLISDDGSTIKSLQGVNFSGFGLQSEEGAKKIKTAGKTTLIIY